MSRIDTEGTSLPWVIPLVTLHNMGFTEEMLELPAIWKEDDCQALTCYLPDPAHPGVILPLHSLLPTAVTVQSADEGQGGALKTGQGMKQCAYLCLSPSAPSLQ